jgi:hypothetical protein
LKPPQNESRMKFGLTGMFDPAKWEQFARLSAQTEAARRRSDPMVGQTYSQRRRRTGMARMGATLCAAAIAAASSILGANGARAEDASVAIELNKLETQGQSCRAYFVVTNKATAYDALKLDLVLFRPDGVIGRRFAVDLGPLKADKRSVKLFDIDGTACEQVGSFLINDVMECKTESGTVPDCLKNLSVSSLTSVQLNK